MVHWYPSSNDRPFNGRKYMTLVENGYEETPLDVLLLAYTRSNSNFKYDGINNHEDKKLDLRVGGEKYHHWYFMMY